MDRSVQARYRPHRVAIVGAGFGGLCAARALRRAGVEVTVIDRTNPLGRLLAERTGVETDRAGRVKVDPDLTVPGHPEIFVLGDLMSLNGLPGVAQVAIQSGRHAAVTIARRAAGDPTRRPFRYRDLGTLVTISRFRALASVGRIEAAGFGAWLVWLVVHVVGLTGFKNRAAALFNWTIAFLGRGRPQRVITAQQVFARRALQLQPAAMPNVPAAGAGRGTGDHDWSAQPEAGSAHPHHPKGVQR